MVATASTNAVLTSTRCELPSLDLLRVISPRNALTTNEALTHT